MIDFLKSKFIKVEIVEINLAVPDTQVSLENVRQAKFEAKIFLINSLIYCFIKANDFVSLGIECILVF